MSSAPRERVHPTDLFALPVEIRHLIYEQATASARRNESLRLLWVCRQIRDEAIPIVAAAGRWQASVDLAIRPPVLHAKIDASVLPPIVKVIMQTGQDVTLVIRNPFEASLYSLTQLALARAACVDARGTAPTRVRTYAVDDPGMGIICDGLYTADVIAVFQDLENVVAAVRRSGPRTRRGPSFDRMRKAIDDYLTHGTHGPGTHDGERQRVMTAVWTLRD